MRFVVDGVPVGKQRPQMSKRGRVFTPKETKDYERRIRWAAIDAWGDRKPMAGAVRLDVGMYYPIPESWPKERREMALDGRLLPMVKPDADNVYKAVADALNGIVYRDDVQVVIGGFMKLYSGQPRIEVCVEPFSICRELPFDDGGLDYE